MHLELLELYRRVQGRVPLPSMEINADLLKRHAAEARPLLRFEDIPLELTELRLLVRQIADILRRHGAIETADHQVVQSLGRDMKLLAAVGDWYRSVAESHAVASVGAAHLPGASPAADDGVVESGARAGDASVPVALRGGAAAAGRSLETGTTRTARCAAANRTSPSSRRRPSVT